MHKKILLYTQENLFIKTLLLLNSCWLLYLFSLSPCILIQDSADPSPRQQIASLFYPSLSSLFLSTVFQICFSISQVSSINRRILPVSSMSEGSGHSIIVGENSTVDKITGKRPKGLSKS